MSKAHSLFRDTLSIPNTEHAGLLNKKRMFYLIDTDLVAICTQNKAKDNKPP